MRDIKTLHLELSSFSNERCPTSHRTVQGYPYNQGFVETNLSLDDCKKIFSPVFLSNLKKIIIGGNFGDFVMNPDSLEIIEYFFQNSLGEIQINTNGSARDLKFWQDLARLGVTVFFHIDGLEDTHALHRPDSDFATILKNAVEFINAGGHAVWKMTVTENNQHQIESANKKSIELGFADFITQDIGPNERVLYDVRGQKVFSLTDDMFWPDTIDDTFVKDKIDHGDTCPVPDRLTGIEIQSECAREKSIYVSADGHVYPCLRSGVNPMRFKPYMRNPWRYYNPEIAQYIKSNHAPTVGLSSAMDWFDDLAQQWTTDQQPRLCQNFCGVKHD